MATKQTDRERAARALWASGRHLADADAALDVAAHLLDLRAKYGPDPHLAHLAAVAITLGRGATARARAASWQAADALDDAAGGGA